MGKIIWLASYPKSGNTWIRIFFSHLIGDSSYSVNLDKLPLCPIASYRHIFDEETCIESSNLLEHEIENLRPKVFEQMSEEAKSPFFIKIHDAYTLSPGMSPLVTDKATLGVIYIIRNPLDIAPSFSHHLGESIDKTILLMGDEKACLGNSKHGKMESQFHQPLLSWSDHVLSWVDKSKLKIHIVRYEDLIAHPFETFEKAVSFAGFSYSREKIEQAIAQSSFEKLKAEEQKYGFREKCYTASSFFRNGKAGSWKGSLTPKQVDSIIITHGEVMKRFNYID